MKGLLNSVLICQSNHEKIAWMFISTHNVYSTKCCKHAKPVLYIQLSIYLYWYLVVNSLTKHVIMKSGTELIFPIRLTFISVLVIFLVTFMVNHVCSELSYIIFDDFISYLTGGFFIRWLTVECLGE